MAFLPPTSRIWSTASRRSRRTSNLSGRKTALVASSGTEFLELCSQHRKPALEDIDNKIADLGRPEGGSVYKPAPTIDWILGADDHLAGIAIHCDEALG